MSEDMRGRFKSTKSNSTPEGREDNIFSIWGDQRRMQTEEDKMASELAETKRKARELQKTLRKHRYGEATEKLSNTKSDFSKIVTKYFSSVKNIFFTAKNWAFGHKKLASIVPVLIIVSVVMVTFVNKKSDPTATLGNSTSVLSVEEDLPREKPEFKLLYPIGAKESDYDVVRISPDNTAASYTYLDRFTDDGQIFRVTQQEVPDSFDLAKTSKDFQATNVIQIDDNIIYHGYSEKGGIQSLIFIKDKKLISIRSPQKFDDDTWASYIISLK